MSKSTFLSVFQSHCKFFYTMRSLSKESLEVCSGVAGGRVLKGCGTEFKAIKGRACSVTLHSGGFTLQVHTRDYVRWRHALKLCYNTVTLIKDSPKHELHVCLNIWVDPALSGPALSGPALSGPALSATKYASPPLILLIRNLPHLSQSLPSLCKIILQLQNFNLSHKPSQQFGIPENTRQNPM